MRFIAGRISDSSPPPHLQESRHAEEVVRLPVENAGAALTPLPLEPRLPIDMDRAGVRGKQLELDAADTEIRGGVDGPIEERRTEAEAPMTGQYADPDHADVARSLVQASPDVAPPDYGTPVACYELQTAAVHE